MIHAIQFLSGVVTAIVVVFALIWFGVVPVRNGDSYGPDLVWEIVSPDGRYVARSQRVSNSRGWCEERTTVDIVGTQSDWEREYVFLNGCGMRVESKWTDKRELLITYGYDANGKAHVYREPRSKDKQVSLSYQMESGGGR